MNSGAQRTRYLEVLVLSLDGHEHGRKHADLASALTTRNKKEGSQGKKRKLLKKIT